MKKRLPLAVFLSILVLIVFGKPTKAPVNFQKQQDAQLQDVENKEVTSEKFITDNKNEEVQPFEEKQINEKEEIHILENDKILVEISNLGGNIKAVTIKQHDRTLPISNILGVEGYERTPFKLEIFEGNKISYVFQNKELTIKKEYELSEDDYLLYPKVIITKRDEAVQPKLIGYYFDVNRLEKNIDKSRDRGLIEYSVGLKDSVFRKTGAVKFSSKEKKDELAEVSWVGYRNRYFCAVIKPDFETIGYDVFPEGARQIYLGLKTKPQAEKSAEYSAVAYFGPQDLKLLKEYNQGLDRIMVFFKLGFFDVIAKLIYKL